MSLYDNPGSGGNKTKPMLILVMGICGSGKTTVAQHLSDAFSFDFLEGDSFHPDTNVAKMAAGTPLNDVDREPWLDAIAAAQQASLDTGSKNGVHVGGESEAEIEGNGGVGVEEGSKEQEPPCDEARGGVVVACSALKQIYRQRLGFCKPKNPEGDNNVNKTSEEGVIRVLIFLAPPSVEVLSERMRSREGHFMPDSLIESQLATLEDPREDSIFAEDADTLTTNGITLLKSSNSDTRLLVVPPELPLSNVQQTLCDALERDR